MSSKAFNRYLTAYDIAKEKDRLYYEVYSNVAIEL
jgi:hypothetical protein